MAEEHANKIERTEDRRKRVSEVIQAIRDVQIQRVFKLHKRYTHISETLMRNISALVVDIPYDPVVDLHGDEVRLEWNDKEWSALLYKHDTVTYSQCEKLTEDIWQFLETGNDISLRRHLRELPSEPKTFYHNPERWSLQPTKASTEESNADMQAVHLASILIGHALTHYPVSHLHNFRNDVEQSIAWQLESFVIQGHLPTKKPDHIDPKGNLVTNPIVGLGDNLDELMWIYSKYCRRCGIKIDSCYCQPVTEEFNHHELILSATCWTCSKREINHALTQEFDEEFTAEVCNEARDLVLDSFLEDAVCQLPDTQPSEEWQKLYGRWFDVVDGKVQWKHIKPEDLKDLWDDVDNLYANFDYEPPDDVCGCLTFMEQ